MKKTLLIFVSLLLEYTAGFAQCCGGCNPIGGNTNQGTLPKYMLQINTYEKHGYSAGYMQNDHASDFQFVKNATSNFVGLSLGYGLTRRLTVEAEGGYYINRTQNFDLPYARYTLNGYGGSSVTLGGKYNIFKDTARDIEFTMGIGVKMPWSKQPQVVNGVELTEDVQPSNGAYGLVLRSFLFKAFDRTDIRIFLMNTVNINGNSIRNYKEGNTYLTSFFVSKTFYRNWTAIAQLRNEIRDYAYRDNVKVTSSGGYRFVFVPQINYNIRKKYNISVLYELPIYQDYYGIQLRDMYAFSVNLNIRLGLNKKANEACERPK
ncbi:MAG: hypothetical protein JST26_11400 [Bacteroidetes bacterium]|nr:hypothetical protein [Bacteroidota bacterium]